MVPYNDLLLNVFSGQEAALIGLVKKEILTVIQDEDGRLSAVTAHSSLVLSALESLVSDQNVARGIEVMQLRSEAEQLQEFIRQAEIELVDLVKSNQMECGRKDDVLARRQEVIKNLNSATKLLAEKEAKIALLGVRLVHQDPAIVKKYAYN